MVKHDYVNNLIQVHFTRDLLMLMYERWPNKTMSKHDFKIISNKADISVNVPNIAKHDYKCMSTHDFKINSTDHTLL